MIYSIMERDSFIISNGCHSENVLMVIIDGSFELKLGEKSVNISKDSVVYFEKNKNFVRKVIEPLKIIYVVFDPEQQISSGVLIFKDNSRKEGTIKLLEEAVISNNTHLVRYFCNDLLTQYRVENKNNVASFSKEITGFFEFVEENYKSKIHIEEYSKSIFMSHTGFLLKFKREVGIPPIKYISNFRLEKAVRLLSESDISISEVADRCGYDNLYYFSNSFKKKYNISPKDFKNNII